MTCLMQRGWRWGGEVELKKRVENEQGGLRWDKEGVPLQRQTLSASECVRARERERESETETRRKTDRWRGSTVAE